MGSGMMRAIRSPAGGMLPALAVTWLATVIPVRADVVGQEGKPVTVGVTILSLDRGELHYRLSTGREVSLPMEQVSYLQISDWPLFNVAEKQREAGDWRKAIASYERELRKLSEPGNQGLPAVSGGLLDRRLLLMCRLAAAYDHEGRFDRAVSTYLDVIERMPGAVESLRPVRMPVAGSTFLDSARDQVDAAIARHQGDDIGRSLKRWRATWPGERKGELEDSPDLSGVSQEVRIARQRIEAVIGQIERGESDRALEQIGRLREAMALAVRPELYYWQGRALLARAGESASDDAQRDRRRAGLSFMRVVIHFPGHRRAPECLLRAGRICEREGKEQPARRLWSELMRSYPSATDMVEAARLAMDQLDKRNAS